MTYRKLFYLTAVFSVLVGFGLWLITRTTVLWASYASPPDHYLSAYIYRGDLFFSGATPLSASAEVLEFGKFRRDPEEQAAKFIGEPPKRNPGYRVPIWAICVSFIITGWLLVLWTERRQRRALPTIEEHQ